MHHINYSFHEFLQNIQRSKAILTRNQDSSNFMAYFISGIIAEAVRY
jgi:hypothetical protein